MPLWLHHLRGRPPPPYHVGIALFGNENLPPLIGDGVGRGEIEQAGNPTAR